MSDISDKISEKKHKVLAVDDYPINLDIIVEALSDEGFDVILATDGDEALEVIEDHHDVDVIILDRMMPRMNGLEVVKRLKIDSRFDHIPIIMQTAFSSPDHIVEGIESGVYYYITKPFRAEVLVSIVKSALFTSEMHKKISKELSQYKHIQGLMDRCELRFRTLEDALNLSFYIASSCPFSKDVAYALNELMVNAIEHGNLGISYHEKNELMKKGLWEEKIAHALSLEENEKRFGRVFFETKKEAIHILIKDEGKGFDWKPYMKLTTDRAMDLNGRSIAEICSLKTLSIEYKNSGNEVLCIIPLTPQNK